MMTFLYCAVSILLFIVGIRIGAVMQRIRLQKELDMHIENTKKTMYSLIDFGMKKGFPFDQINQIEKRSEKFPLSKRDSLYLALKQALKVEDYEEASKLRDKIQEHEKGESNN